MTAKSSRAALQRPLCGFASAPSTGSERRRLVCRPVVLYTCPVGKRGAPLHPCGKAARVLDRWKQKRRSPRASAPALSPM